MPCIIHLRLGREIRHRAPIVQARGQIVRQGLGQLALLSLLVAEAADVGAVGVLDVHGWLVGDVR